MTTPDRAASAARRDAAYASMPDQLTPRKLVARLLVPGAPTTVAFVALAPLVKVVGFFTKVNHRLRSPPPLTLETRSDSPLKVHGIAAARADSPAAPSTHSTLSLAERSSQRAREDSDSQPKPLARY